MKKSIFVKRLLAAIIDHIFVLILLFSVCALVVTTVFVDVFNQQMAPFVVVQLLLNPLSLFFQLVSTPQAYGNVSVIYVLSILSFCVEVLYYTLFEFLPIKRTPGYLFLGIQIDYNTKKMLTFRIVIRNVLKVFSRYVYCVPFVALILNKNGNTIYDLITKINVKTIAVDK